MSGFVQSLQSAPAGRARPAPPHALNGDPAARESLASLPQESAVQNCLNRCDAPRDQLRSALRGLFQIADDQLLDEVGDALTLVQLQSGDSLVSQGEQSN